MMESALQLVHQQPSNTVKIVIEEKNCKPLRTDPTQ